MFNHSITCTGTIFNQNRVRNTIREITIRLMMNLNKFDWNIEFFKFNLNCINHMTRCTITCIHHQLHWSDFCWINITHQVINKFRQDIIFFCRTLTCNFSEFIIFSQCLNVFKAGICANRTSIFTDQFHSVIIHRVMTGSNFNATLNIQMKCTKVNFFSAGHAQIEDIDTCII